MEGLTVKDLLKKMYANLQERNPHREINLDDEVAHFSEFPQDRGRY